MLPLQGSFVSAQARREGRGLQAIDQTFPATTVASGSRANAADFFDCALGPVVRPNQEDNAVDEPEGVAEHESKKTAKAKDDAATSKLSALDAAAKVLQEVGQPMNCWATPAAGLRLVERSFVPLGEPSVSVPTTALSAATQLASGLVVLLLLLAMSGLPSGGGYSPPYGGPMNLAQDIAALPTLSVSQLRQRYAEIFGETTNAGHKGWLVKRIAWRLQALAEGDLLFGTAW
jgi:hypothetical protein